MNRRGFIKALVGAIASVAIATKVAPRFPTTERFKISRETVEDTYAEMGTRMHEALAKSMMQTKENVATRVYWDNQSEMLHVEGISREEMYET